VQTTRDLPSSAQLHGVSLASVVLPCESNVLTSGSPVANPKSVYSPEAGASGEYTITPEDGRVRPKHVDD
jgi:hypothetical protein